MNLSLGLSLEDISFQNGNDPSFIRTMSRYACKDNSDFLSVLALDLEDAIDDLIKKRDLYNKKNSCEDLITLSLATFLKGCGYRASHDTKDGGHVDLTVKHVKLNVQWKAEAKIWNGVSYVEDGWLQLTERYLTGGPLDSDAGLLIYCFQKDAYSKLVDWLSHLSSRHSVTNTHDQNSLRALSKCKLPSSGTDVNIKHFMINLWFPTTTHQAAV